MEKKPDILLVYPTFRNETFYHLKFDWHLGSSYILAYLKTRAVHALQFIQREPIGMDRLIEQLLSYSPKIIGFTCYDVNYFFVKLISQELKKRRKDITIVAGGPTATFSDELILRDARAIDVCVRGEGEQAAAEIIDHVNGKTEIGGIKGISYRRKGSIVRNLDRPSLRGKANSKALDIFPSPYLTGILPPDGRIGILTSRGCVYHCTYCSFSAMSGWKVSYHSTERVLSELRIISEARNKPRSQQNLVSIHDDAFSLNTQRAKEICRRIIKENVSLPLWCETRGDRVDEELLGLMKKANFRIISFGLESAVPENLRIIKKVVSDKTADRALSRERVFIDKIEAMTNRAKELGMNVTLSVIVGLPGQTQKQAEKTIDFVRKLAPRFYHHDYLTLYPGTPLFNTRKDFGLDIIPSKTTLPYKTRFLFDVAKVTVLPNAMQRYSIVEMLTDAAVSFLTRDMLLFQDSIGIPAVVVKGYTSGIRKLIEKNKIKGSLTLSPLFFLLQENTKDIRGDLEDLIEKDFPVINLLSLRKVDSHKKGLHRDAKSYELVFLTDVIERRRLSFQRLALFTFLPISSLRQKDAGSKIKGNGYDRNVILLTLDNVRDQTDFKRLFSDSSPLEDFLKRNSEADCFMLNQCQWSDRPCPIPKEKGLFVDGQGRGVPCHNCRGAKYDADKAFAEAEKTRGCDICPANKACSKCLFTSPFSEREFCDIRRSADTGKWLTLLEKHNRLNSFARKKNFLARSF